MHIEPRMKWLASTWQVAGNYLHHGLVSLSLPVSDSQLLLHKCIHIYEILGTLGDPVYTQYEAK